MLRSEAILIIKRGLGFRQTQDPAIIAALKQAQRDLELGQTLPNWLLAFSIPITVAAGDSAPLLPAGFIRLHEDFPLYYGNDEGNAVYLRRRRNDEAFAVMGESNEAEVLTATRPTEFVLLNKYFIQLFPLPTEAFTLRMTYYKAADVLDSDIENAWLKYAPNYLIGLAGMMVAGDLRDKGASEKFSLMAKLGGKAMLSDVVEDELAGRVLIMGRNN